MTTLAAIRSAFSSPLDETSGMGKRPVILDILGPDWETSLLPDDLKMVLHVNPSSFAIQYNRKVERTQTRGGWVEFHWGDEPTEISMEQATGAFIRLYSGLSNITNPKYGGTRRETIAYDKYLDLLALFHNNGSIYDSRGNIVLQGIIKLTFDGGVYLGWFNNCTVNESADKTYQFMITTAFTVKQEIMSWKSTLSSSEGISSSSNPQSASETIPFSEDG